MVYSGGAAGDGAVWVPYQGGACGKGRVGRDREPYCSIWTYMHYTSKSCTYYVQPYENLYKNKKIHEYIRTYINLA